MLVTKVEMLEPLSLRKKWINDLAQAVAFLESLNLAHGDLRPENVLLDRNRLKVSDFDCTAEIGSDFEACMAPYGRILNSNEPDQGRCGNAGFLGSRTEQFALGSLYYLIEYGYEVYGDRRLVDDPKEHGPKVVDLLQNMEFPELNGDSVIDAIIHKCWHNKNATISELAAYTKTILPEGIEGIEGEESDPGAISIPGLEQNNSAEDLSSRRAYCQDLEKRGLLDTLSSGEPEQLGFSFKWYRHICHGN